MFKSSYILFFFISSLIGYEVGETVTVVHQNMDFNICYGQGLDPNSDGIFNFSEYNGDLNGGQYYVIFLEMMATW